MPSRFISTCVLHSRARREARRQARLTGNSHSARHLSPAHSLLVSIGIEVDDDAVQVWRTHACRPAACGRGRRRAAAAASGGEVGMAPALS